MSLTDFASTKDWTPGPRCRYSLLPPEVREEIEANPHLPATVISEWLLKEKGLKCSDQTVAKHRSGRCACDRGA